MPSAHQPPLLPHPETSRLFSIISKWLGNNNTNSSTPTKKNHRRRLTLHRGAPSGSAPKSHFKRKRNRRRHRRTMHFYVQLFLIEFFPLFFFLFVPRTDLSPPPPLHLSPLRCIKKKKRHFPPLHPPPTHRVITEDGETRLSG